MLPLLVLPTLALVAAAFDVSSQSNFIAYWGQSSAGSQQSLGDYCKSTSTNAFALSFLYQFPNTKLDLSDNCRSTFDGSDLIHCPDIAADIKLCQSQGKAILLSMGGAAGAYGFSSDEEARSYADTVWDMFLGGSGEQRPFDDAVLDGIDLDIEGGSTSGYAAYVAQLRSHFEGGDKSYYITAAPQCPFPDAMLGSTLDSAYFDMVFVQFYNNFCGLDAYPQGFNYDQWDAWATSQSQNKNVKIYIGAPGSQNAAGRGFVDASTINTIVSDIRGKYKSFGGVMTWDASQAFDAGDWGQSVTSGLMSSAAAKRRSLDGAISSGPILTRAANITAEATPARVELVQRSVVPGLDAADETFAFLVKIRSSSQPIPGGWEMHIPLPLGVEVAEVHARGYTAAIHESTLVVTDTGGSGKNMALAVHVAGRHGGDSFGLPDPAGIMLLSA